MLEINKYFRSDGRLGEAWNSYREPHEYMYTEDKRHELI
jgi:hypothetical protein